MPHIIAVLGTLVTALGILWRMLDNHFKREYTEKQEYKKLYFEQSSEMKELSREVGELKGGMEAVTTLSSSVSNRIDEIKTLSSEVLVEVRKANGRQY